MDVPAGFFNTLWSFITFLPFFFLLFLLGLLKGAIICPIAAGIITIGDSAVVIGLWPAHCIWTYYCVIKTKRLGWVLKILLVLCLPLPLVLWPTIVIVASILGGIAYGFFAPLIATFEFIGRNTTEKTLHCFIDGVIPTIGGSCTVVRDLTDFCFHSYFSFMDELIEEIPADENPVDVKLLKLPQCLLVMVLAVPVDVPLITAIALWKSPYMLYRGWKRLFEDLVGREGPFLETVCVPFAALAIILWPLAVVGALIGAFFSSFFLGLYSGVIVQQEDSFQMGLAFLIAVISLFDEYTNDMLYLREGSCFPSLMAARPKYRRNMDPPNSIERMKSIENESVKTKERECLQGTKLASQRSKTLKWAIQQYTVVQVWDWLFKSCEVNGRILLRDGLLDVKDIAECILKGNCKKLEIKLPAWTILQCLLASAKSESPGLLISDDIQLTATNWPRDKMFEWFVGPLLIMKEQIKGMKLEENEEICLKKLVMGYKNENTEDWDDSDFPSSDTVRRAQLQAIIRRLQGIIGFMSRMPTFRRRFRNLVKVLYLDVIETGQEADQDGTHVKPKRGGRFFLGRGQKKDKGNIVETSSRNKSNHADMV
ncbi:putative membrane protein At3g27390 isoform X1 [Apium graveolens]